MLYFIHLAELNTLSKITFDGKTESTGAIFKHSMLHKMNEDKIEDTKDTFNFLLDGFVSRGTLKQVT